MLAQVVDAVFERYMRRLERLWGAPPQADDVAGCLTQGFVRWLTGQLALCVAFDVVPESAYYAARLRDDVLATASLGLDDVQRLRAVFDQYVDLLMDHGVDGIGFVSGLHADTSASKDRYHRLRGRGVPLVLVNGYAEGVDAPAVSTDDTAAMDQAMRHLRSLGHRAVGLAIGPTRFVPSQRKREAFAALIERDPSRKVKLVVEDNLDAAETLRMVLEMEGLEVEVAHDGREGLAKARMFHPDLVLCDLGLPILDGYEVARALRADPELSSSTLVAVTGYALPDDQRRAIDAGFDRHLAKPVPFAELESVLQGASRRH